MADIGERGFCAQYMHAYAGCLGTRSTKAAPWYVVPAYDEENVRLIISTIALETFKSLPRYPESDNRRRPELVAIRKRLASEEPSSASRKGAGVPEARP